MDGQKEVLRQTCGDVSPRSPADGMTGLGYPRKDFLRVEVEEGQLMTSYYYYNGKKTRTQYSCSKPELARQAADPNMGIQNRSRCMRV